MSKESISKLNNKQLYTKIINSIELMNEFSVGDEMVIYDPLNKNYNLRSIMYSIILEINNTHIVFRTTICKNKKISSTSKLTITYLFNILNNNKIIVYKKKIQTIEDIKNKQNLLNDFNQFIIEAKLSPIELNELTITFIGEDYRNGRDLFYKKELKCL